MIESICYTCGGRLELSTAHCTPYIPAPRLRCVDCGRPEWSRKKLRAYAREIGA